MQEQPESSREGPRRAQDANKSSSRMWEEKEEKQREFLLDISCPMVPRTRDSAERGNEKRPQPLRNEGMTTGLYMREGNQRK